MSFIIETLPSCSSTNAVLAERLEAPHGFILSTRCQTAGRGQRGNSWESEPGKNLTFSVLLRPKGFPAIRQFEISMLVALAVADFLNDIFARLGRPDLSARIKWPNDIYIGDFKIAGILIENKLEGSLIDRAIAGIGVNVSQTVFTSDAPNPISIAILTGISLNPEDLLGYLGDRIVSYIDQYLSAPQPEALKETYMQLLYPAPDQEATYVEPGGTPFRAAVADIDLDGHMHLSNGRKYAFKEIALVL